MSKNQKISELLNQLPTILSEATHSAPKTKLIVEKLKALGFFEPIFVGVLVEFTAGLGFTLQGFNDELLMAYNERVSGTMLILLKEFNRVAIEAVGKSKPVKTILRSLATMGYNSPIYGVVCVNAAD